MRPVPSLSAPPERPERRARISARIESGHLGRRVGADVETRRACDAVDRVCLHARFQEPLAPALLVSASAEGTDVERVRLERTR